MDTESLMPPDGFEDDVYFYSWFAKACCPMFENEVKEDEVDDWVLISIPKW